MSDSTLDRIRDVNPYPVELAPLPIEMVQRRIAETGASPQVRPRRISVPGSGAVIAGLGAAVAVAVAVLAIVTLGHRAPRVSPAGTGRPSNPGARVTGVRAERRGPAPSLSTARTQPLAGAELSGKIHTPAFANAAGEATLVRVNGQIGLTISTSGLPSTPTGTAYGVWLLSTSTAKATFLGLIARQPRDGHVNAEVPLTASMMRTDSSIELTLEHGTTVRLVPGEVVLRGKLP